MEGTGKLIAFEGQDGAGKSTAIAKVVAALRERGHEVVEIREPGGTEAGERIRDLLKSDVPQEGRTEALLFAAARAQLAEEVIKPALARGAVVCSDRSYVSSLAYQGVARGLGVEEVRAINVYALAGALPDRVLLLELSAEESSRRIGARHDLGEVSKDRFEDDAFQRRVQVAYDTLADQEGYVRVSADGTPDEVGARCLEALWDLFAD